ncbi:unnamed protein product [Vitrella brassicaformis CCMP3155]|uniref:Protein kinase domain-containing protein n=1 Tax=Vitrella brassicaformis (strain CCMP3155) TaxID=1169540 RepID=A0A0G4EML9_VITBC|nr:unnamed protein product [Vitrella brassicaformis CCMP3155]|eukprot:CEL98224.1 unnamed protein product [Vitrella brassicaformis CCMP3155]
MRALKRLGPVEEHADQEILALRRAMAIVSPNIARVKSTYRVRQSDSPSATGGVFLEMDVYQENLRQEDTLGRSLIDEQEARDLLFPLVVCLRDLLNKAGVLHGDIKSGNTMVDGEKGGAVLKLIDFGNSAIADTQEQLKGIGARRAIQDDICGLGHLIGELLYGPPKRRGCFTHFNVSTNKRLCLSWVTAASSGLSVPFYYLLSAPLLERDIHRMIVLSDDQWRQPFAIHIIIDTSRLGATAYLYTTEQPVEWEKGAARFPFTVVSARAVMGADASPAAYDLYDRMTRRPHTLTYDEILQYPWFARGWEGFWKPCRQPAADTAPPCPPGSLDDDIGQPAACPLYADDLTENLRQVERAVLEVLSSKAKKEILVARRPAVFVFALVVIKVAHESPNSLHEMADGAFVFVCGRPRASGEGRVDMCLGL